MTSPTTTDTARAGAAIPKVKRLASWFGANTALAHRVGEQLGQLAWCGVPFAGGCSELPYIRTRSGMASDLHRHIINLARVVGDSDLLPELFARLDGMLFHPDELAGAQHRCRQRETPLTPGLFDRPWTCLHDGDVGWAADYFACVWMARGGHAGKASEFTQSLAVRRTSSGGDSAVRWRSAIDALQAWHLSLRDWQFVVMDCFDFLELVKDQLGHGLYCDPPWPKVGHEYKHRFSEEQHRRLAARLMRFQSTRIVVRCCDDDLIRGIYPAADWRWVMNESRNQRNNIIQECLLVRGPEIDE